MASETTIRHLMTHTSGLVRYEFQEKFTADLTRQPDKSWQPEELISYILDLTPPFAPGAGWEYSDTNYIVLGMILERAGKAPYYDLLRDRILGPLKLKDTVPSTGRTIPGLVQGYAGPQNPFGGTDAMIKDGRFAINPQFEWTGGRTGLHGRGPGPLGQGPLRGQGLRSRPPAGDARRRPGQVGPRTRSTASGSSSGRRRSGRVTATAAISRAT